MGWALLILLFSCGSQGLYWRTEFQVERSVCRKLWCFIHGFHSESGWNWDCFDCGMEIQTTKSGHLVFTFFHSNETFEHSWDWPVFFQFVKLNPSASFQVSSLLNCIFPIVLCCLMETIVQDPDAPILPCGQVPCVDYIVMMLPDSWESYIALPLLAIGQPTWHYRRGQRKWGPELHLSWGNVLIGFSQFNIWLNMSS